MSLSPSQDSEQTLDKAIAAIRAGETERGRTLLAQVLHDNLSCENA